MGYLKPQISPKKSLKFYARQEPVAPLLTMPLAFVTHIMHQFCDVTTVS